jgi:hypothetical protein
MTPVGAVLRGAVAGAVGTVALDGVWFSRYKRVGWETGFIDWEFAPEIHGWDEAPAPALFGRRLVEAILQRDTPLERAPLVNNVVHWLTGLGWGAVFGLLGGSVSTHRVWYGLVFGAGSGCSRMRCWCPRSCISRCGNRREDDVERLQRTPCVRPRHGHHFSRAGETLTGDYIQAGRLNRLVALTDLGFSEQVGQLFWHWGQKRCAATCAGSTHHLPQMTAVSGRVAVQQDQRWPSTLVEVMHPRPVDVFELTDERV